MFYFLSKIRQKIKDQLQNKRLLEIYSRVKDYTMVDPTLFCDNLKLLDNIKDLNGDIVECGVWKGGMSAALAFNIDKNRHFHLFDSFEGLPAPKQLDGEAAKAWSRGEMPNIFYNNCSAEETSAIQIMNETGQTFTTYKGWFEDTIPNNKIGEIALLRLDGDWYESTLICLEYLYPKLTQSGVVILDDYYTWDGCSKAVHDYLSKIKSRAKIDRTKNGVVYIVKRD